MPPRKLIALLLLCNVVSVGFALAVKHLFGSVTDSSPGDREQEKLQHNRQASVPSTQVAAETSPVRVVPQEERVPIIPPSPSQEIYATGYVTRGKRVNVVMSDGSVRTEEDNPTRAQRLEGKKDRLTYVGRNFVDWDGKRYWFKPHISQTGAGVAPVRAEPVERTQDPLVIGGKVTDRAGVSRESSGPSKPAVSIHQVSGPKL